MKVAIAGGHGQIARRLTRLLAASGDEVVALIRNPDHSDDVQSDGAQPAVIDLEQAEPADVAEAIAGTDAVVFAAGAGPGSGATRKQTMDLGGAVKLLDAAKSAGAGHYVMVSSIGADPSASEGDMAPYLRAKGRADEAVRAGGIPHTIVRPGRLTNDPGSGRVHAAPDAERGDIPRDDVAAVLAAVLAGGPLDTTFVLVSGDDAIDEALAALRAG